MRKAILVTMLCLLLSGAFALGSPGTSTPVANDTVNPSLSIHSQDGGEAWYIGDTDNVLGAASDTVLKINATKTGIPPVLQLELTDLGQMLLSWAANGYRLPTEMEWMFAAKGGNLSQGYTYSGSNDVDAVSWYYWNSDNTTHAVGGKLANELGFFDMSGNVTEWAWDIFEFYPTGAQTNPTGPTSGAQRIMRGGNYSNDEAYSVVSIRLGNYADNGLSSIGFRVCRALP